MGSSEGFAARLRSRVSSGVANISVVDSGGEYVDHAIQRAASLWMGQCGPNFSDIRNRSGEVVAMRERVKRLCEPIEMAYLHRVMRSSESLFDGSQ